MISNLDATERMPEKKYLYGASVIIGKANNSQSLVRVLTIALRSTVEGIMTMCSKELRDLFDLKVFVVSCGICSTISITRQPDQQSVIARTRTLT